MMITGRSMIARACSPRVGVVAAIMAACAIASACGGGSGDSSKKDEGAAAIAVSEFFHQEAAGDRLPDGVNVISGGTEAIKALAVSAEKKKSP